MTFWSKQNVFLRKPQLINISVSIKYVLFGAAEQLQMFLPVFINEATARDGEDHVPFDDHQSVRGSMYGHIA